MSEKLGKWRVLDGWIDQHAQHGYPNRIKEITPDNVNEKTKSNKIGDEISSFSDFSDSMQMSINVALMRVTDASVME